MVSLLTCLLMRWKYCAGVVGWTTCMLTASPSLLSIRLSVNCRKRSSREEECSGPAPSYPCGSSITKPLCRSHFAGEGSRQ